MRQVVILAEGAGWRSAYELYARSAGLPGQVVRALAVPASCPANCPPPSRPLGGSPTS